MLRHGTWAAAALLSFALCGCEEPAEECTVYTECCELCVEGRACGDECIGAGETCDRIAGCACDADDVCRGGGGPRGARLEYSTCVGPRGSCSETCCTSLEDRSFFEGAVVSCSVRSAADGGYRLTVTAYDAAEENGIDAADIAFGADPLAFGPAEDCASFEVVDQHNQYPADSCASLDVRPDEPYGGGCELELRLNRIGIVDGRFTCKELQLPAQELFLSTVSAGAVEAGTFSLYNCEQRL